MENKSRRKRNHARQETAKADHELALAPARENRRAAQHQARRPRLRPQKRQKPSAERISRALIFSPLPKLVKKLIWARETTSNQGDSVMKESPFRLPIAVVAQLMGITEAEAEKEFRAACSEVLDCLGVAHEGKKPEVAMDEVMATLVAANQEKELRLKLDAEVNTSSFTDWWLVFEGDWGGQIYLTVPWRLIGQNARLFELLRFLDQLAWECNDGEGRSLYLYSPKQLRQRFQEQGWNPREVPLKIVSGGMGGGRLLSNRFWLHEEFSQNTKILEQVQKLLNTNLC